MRPPEAPESAERAKTQKNPSPTQKRARKRFGGQKRPKKTRRPAAKTLGTATAEAQPSRKPGLAETEPRERRKRRSPEAAAAEAGPKRKQTTATGNPATEAPGATRGRSWPPKQWSNRGAATGQPALPKAECQSPEVARGRIKSRIESWLEKGRSMIEKTALDGKVSLDGRGGRSTSRPR